MLTKDQPDAGPSSHNPDVHPTDPGIPDYPEFVPQGDFFTVDCVSPTAHYKIDPLNVTTGYEHQAVEVDDFVQYLFNRKKEDDDVGDRFPITLIAHSNGGLAARAYLAFIPGFSERISQLITYGTSKRGSRGR